MRRLLALIALTIVVKSGSAWAGPAAASGPITVDSTTFVAGQSVMGTDGGVYSDTLPPIASTTTAAFRMTKYRAQHVNLRDNSGVEIGTSGNPLFIAGTSTYTIANVTVSNSSFSVTGSTVSLTPGTSVAITGTPNVSVTNTPSVTVTGSLPAGTNNIGKVSGSTVTVSNTGFAVTNTPGVNVINTPAVVATQSVASALKASVSISGSSNTVAAQQSGSWTDTVVQTIPASLQASASINGSSNTVRAVQSGTWTITNSSFTVNGSTVGVNVIGTVPVSGTFWPATQPVSGTVAVSNSSFSVTGSTVNVNVNGTVPVLATQAGTYTVTPGTGTWAISGSVTASQGPISVLGVSGSTITVGYQAGASSVPVNVINTVPVTGTFFQATQPVSGSVTATISGTPSVNATSVNTSTVTFNGVAQPVLATQAGTYTVTPGTGTWPISGSVTATAGPISILGVSGSTTTVGYQTGASSVPVNVLNFPATQAVSGTIAATQSGSWATTVTQSGTRWSTAFSTTTTSAVLSSTGVTTAVAISTPIAGLSSQTVRVFRLILSANGATNITFRDGSTNFGETYYLTGSGSITLDLTNEPWYITSASNGFVVQQSGSATLGIRIWYTQS